MQVGLICVHANFERQFVIAFCHELSRFSSHIKEFLADKQFIYSFTRQYWFTMYFDFWGYNLHFWWVTRHESIVIYHWEQKCNSDQCCKVTRKHLYIWKVFVSSKDSNWYSDFAIHGVIKYYIILTDSKSDPSILICNAH